MIQVTMQEWVILTFIKTYKQQHGYSPSARDVAMGCGISNRYAAYRLLVKLKYAGLLNFAGNGRGRAITLFDVRVGVMP